MAIAAASSHDYSLVDGTGRVMEGGSVVVQTRTTPPSIIDLQPRDSQGRAVASARAGVYDIVNGTMKIAWAAPGAPRPTSLANASTYTTQ
jgi:hypothetical protein